MSSLHTAVSADGIVVGAVVVPGTTGEGVVVGNAVDVGTVVGICVGCSVSAEVGSSVGISELNGCIMVGEKVGNPVGDTVESLQRHGTNRAHVPVFV